MIRKVLVLLVTVLAICSCSRINQELETSITPTDVGAIEVDAYMYSHETPYDSEIFTEADNELFIDYEQLCTNYYEVSLEEIDCEYASDESVSCIDDFKIVNLDLALSLGLDINDLTLIRIPRGYYYAIFEYPERYRQKYTFDLSRNQGGEWWMLIKNWWDDKDTSPSTCQNSGSDRYFMILPLSDGRITTKGFEGGHVSLVSDITTSQWDIWGIQIFVFGGDVTLIGGRGTLTQIPEFHDDTFYFPLATDADLIHSGGISFASREFEMQYIMYHELPESNLWRLLSFGS